MSAVSDVLDATRKFRRDRFLGGALLRALGLALGLLILLPLRISAQISDGAHGGNPYFYFLPPIVDSAPAATGDFIATVNPVVQICEWGPRGCILPPLAELGVGSGSGPNRLRVVAQDEHYIANWDARRYDGFDPAKSYRVRVLLRWDNFEDELGHVDLDLVTNPIKFRIERGASPIGELTSAERQKISARVVQSFLQSPGEAVEVLLNLNEDAAATFSPVPGIEVIRDFRPTLALLFVRVADSRTLADLVESTSLVYVYENRRYVPVVKDWQEQIGQEVAQASGYAGAGSVVALLDDGGARLSGGPLPGVVIDGDGYYDVRKGVVDLSLSEFGGCSGVGTPSSCRVIEEDAYLDRKLDNHATRVALRLSETAPEARIVALDFFNALDFWGGADVATAATWVLENQGRYNFVVFNMSFAEPAGDGGVYAPGECPSGEDYYFQKLRDAGIMPIAGAGNDGFFQKNMLNGFTGISHPACSPLVVSVGGSENDVDAIWSDSTRGPGLDLLAPAHDRSRSGTSIATPTVSGAWAVLRAALPSLTLEETLDLVKATGTPIFDPESGLTFPRIQLDAALRAAGLPLLESSCPCFTREDLDVVAWDLWCEWSSGDAYLIDDVGPDSGHSGTPMMSAQAIAGQSECQNGGWGDRVGFQSVLEREARKCLTLIREVAEAQGVSQGCLIDYP